MDFTIAIENFKRIICKELDCTGIVKDILALVYFISNGGLLQMGFL